MNSDRHKLLQWASQGDIPADKLPQAIVAANVNPNSDQWRSFIDRLLLWAGSTALACGIIFFIAFNWEALGRFAKFGLIEAVIIISTFLYFKLDKDSLPAKACLLFSSLSLGALMAFYGQTYQTGADPWQLFIYWALLILPWVIVARFAPLAMLWIGLINVGIYLYVDLYHRSWGFWLNQEVYIWLLFFALNSVLHVSWEWLGKYSQAYAVRWAPRILAIASGGLITLLTCYFIIDHSNATAHTIVTYPLWLAGMYYAYRKRDIDLFMLAGMSISLVTVLSTTLTWFLIETLDEAIVNGAFFIAIFVLVITSYLAKWLKSVYKETL